MSGGRSRLHTAFLVATGLVGWLVMLAAARASGLPPVGTWEAAALFLAVVAGARALSFPLPGTNGAEISLDSAIFIAAVFYFGPAHTALGVAVILALDGWRRGRIADALYLGGVAGALLYGWARVFQVELPSTPPAVMAWLPAALGVVFLVSHYGLQALQQWLGGAAWRAALKRNAYSVAAEAALLPLASAIVLLFDLRRPVPFALLGGTYLLVNYGFARMSELAASLRRRVDELETLNRTAHALGATLEAPLLLAAMLRETARALPMAARIEAIVEIDGRLVVYRLERGELSSLAADGAARAALTHTQPVQENDVHDAARPEVRARLLVPLVMYGEATGALVAEAAAPDVFGYDELRLFDAIGGQAAAAVENARLYALANVDGLTGLYVRRYFDMRVAEEIERARRFGTSFALVMLDLDDFKRLNDTYGHLVGDRALRDVATLAASQLRGVDLAARYGGEELAFLLPRTNLADAHAVAERIRAAVEGHEFDGLHITASLGVAGWTEAGVELPERLVERTDAALYRAKAAGKNRVEIDLSSFELTPSLA
ncbi:MAG TPA: sensor domain-containing diguanylate cyclase, partial [Polyangia bacterium]|nr:sensor domain-containing diguanylate cyclase [Polyangia bacterium]